MSSYLDKYRSSSSSGDSYGEGDRPSSSSSSSSSLYDQYAPSLSSFESSSVSTNESFLNSNSFIAKVALLLLVIIIFFVLLRVTIILLSWIFSPGNVTYVVNGLSDASTALVFPQNPASKNAVPIPRSVNETSGIEFSWSIWIFVKPGLGPTGAPHHVFNKGATGLNSGIANTNAPGLYMSSDYSALNIYMDTYNTKGTSTTVNNLPINKWVNVIIRMSNTTMDVYVNGRLAKRKTLDSPPLQNYDSVNVCQNNGFSGYIADLKYYNKAIGTTEMQDIVSNGPSTSMNNDELIKNRPQYLGLGWYYNQ